MPDFQMCSDGSCPYSKQCKRHLDSGAKANMYSQARGMFVKNGPPDKPENCEGYFEKEESLDVLDIPDFLWRVK